MVPTNYCCGRRQSYPNPIRMVRKSFRLGLLRKICTVRFSFNKQKAAGAQTQLRVQTKAAANN